jgi:hypothetical protein
MFESPDGADDAITNQADTEIHCQAPIDLIWLVLRFRGEEAQNAEVNRVAEQHCEKRSPEGSLH